MVGGCERHTCCFEFAYYVCVIGGWQLGLLWCSTMWLIGLATKEAAHLCKATGGIVFPKQALALAWLVDEVNQFICFFFVGSTIH